jgi:hypothetical protein
VVLPVTYTTRIPNGSSSQHNHAGSYTSAAIRPMCRSDSLCNSKRDGHPSCLSLIVSDIDAIRFG